MPLAPAPAPTREPRSVHTGPSLTRRQALRLAAGLALQPLLAAPALAGGRLQPGAPAALNDDPFRLGVAAGEPRAGGFVLWTRLAPEPLSNASDVAGGLGGGDILLRCEVAEDPDMQRIVRNELAIAEAGFAHSVHLELGGLEPDRP